jgi:hypothetical protein
VRAKWLLYKEKWILNDDIAPDHEQKQKLFPLAEYNKMESLCKDMEQARVSYRNNIFSAQHYSQE